MSSSGSKSAADLLAVFGELSSVNLSVCFLQKVRISLYLMGEKKLKGPNDEQCCHLLHGPRDKHLGFKVKREKIILSP